MVSKNLRSLQISSIVLWALLLVQGSIKGQNEQVIFDSIFSHVYDGNLDAQKSSKVLKSNKPAILVSTSHCSACVKYFAQSQKNYQFIFVINNRSLLEVNRLLEFYKLKAKDVYFVVPDDITQKKKIILSGPTPLAFTKDGSSLYFIDYPVLIKITNEFTAPYKEAARAFQFKE